jgi:CheY-like chemotaxis protein
MHGGSVTVASLGAGQGSTFTVKIPLLEKVKVAEATEATGETTGEFPTPASGTGAESCTSSARLSGIRVLVVDDEADSRDYVTFVLEEAGATVTSVSSAVAALEILEILTLQPDVLVSDIGMPEMDGYMLMQKIRALSPEAGGNIPAIALSAYAGEFDRQRALVAGFQRHLAKPVEPERLIETIALTVKVASSTGKR